MPAKRLVKASVVSGVATSTASAFVHKMRLPTNVLSHWTHAPSDRRSQSVAVGTEKALDHVFASLCAELVLSQDASMIAHLAPYIPGAAFFLTTSSFIRLVAAVRFVGEKLIGSTVVQAALCTCIPYVHVKGKQKLVLVV